MLVERAAVEETGERVGASRLFELDREGREPRAVGERAREQRDEQDRQPRDEAEDHPGDDRRPAADRRVQPPVGNGDHDSPAGAGDARRREGARSARGLDGPRGSVRQQRTRERRVGRRQRGRTCVRARREHAALAVEQVDRVRVGRDRVVHERAQGRSRHLVGDAEHAATVRRCDRHGNRGDRFAPDCGRDDFRDGDAALLGGGEMRVARGDLGAHQRRGRRDDLHHPAGRVEQHRGPAAERGCREPEALRGDLAPVEELLGGRLLALSLLRKERRDEPGRGRATKPEDADDVRARLVARDHDPGREAPEEQREAKRGEQQRPRPADRERVSGASLHVWARRRSGG